LTELHLDGTTILVSTPYMDEADRCSRVGLMYEGELIICDSPQKIRDQLEGDLIELVPQDWQKAQGHMASLPGVLEVQTYGEAFHLLVDDGEKRLPQIEQVLSEKDIPYESIRQATARMEEAFISLVRRMEDVSEQGPIQGDS
jgi:ABC-2 type transport system ATP-binding protein